MNQDQALVRIQSVLKLKTKTEARHFCTEVKQIGMKDYSNTEIANCVEENWKPGINPRFVAKILMLGHKVKKAKSPVKTKVHIRRKSVSPIAEKLRLTIEQAEYICRQIQSIAKKPIPLADIAIAAQHTHRHGAIQSKSDLAKLAGELYIKARNEMIEQEDEEMKKKDARVRNMVPFHEQAAPKYVIDEFGFIIRNPELPEDDKSD